MILLDTDHVTLLQWGNAAGARIRERLKLLGLTESAPTSIVTYEEQIRGWMKELASAKSIAHEVEVYVRLRSHLAYFATFDIFDFSEKAAIQFQQFKRLKIRIGTMDLKIAAIALANHVTVWTRNVLDFSMVPGLQIQDVSR